MKHSKHHKSGGMHKKMASHHDDQRMGIMHYGTQEGEGGDGFSKGGKSHHKGSRKKMAMGGCASSLTRW